MKGLILYFLLLVLEILFDLGQDVSHKQGKFSKTLLEKSFEFVLSRKNGIIAFNLRFVLLSIESNLISKKQSCKRDAFMARGFGHVKIILILLAEVIALYMRAFIVKVWVLDLKEQLQNTVFT